MSNSLYGFKKNKNDKLSKSTQEIKKSLLDFFTSQNEDYNDNEENENQSFLGSTFSRVKSSISSQTESLQNITNKMNEVQEAANSWKTFSIFFGIGIVLIFISLTFLPLIILMPTKFASLFSLGCLSLLISLAILKGPKKFYEGLMQKEKIFYTLSYVVTLFLTLYFSILKGTYVYTIISAGLQVFSLAFLIASNFPGGTSGMKFMTKQCFSCFSVLFESCFKQSQQQFLPL